MNRDERKKLKELRRKSNQVLNKLSRRPSDSALVSLLNEIDIKIVTITGEKTLEY